MDEVIKIIDVEKAIRSSKSKFVRSLPRFIVWFIVKLIHQDEMNATISIGKGIPWQTFSTEKSQNDWAQYVKEVVCNIPADKH